MTSSYLRVFWKSTVAAAPNGQSFIRLNAFRTEQIDDRYLLTFYIYFFPKNVFALLFFQDSPTFVSPSVDYFDFLLFSLGLIHVISRCRILKWQAIAWTIENPVRWLMCMSLGSQLPLCPGWLIIHTIPKKIHRYVLGNNDILIFNPVYRVESYMITEDYKKQRRLLCTDISLLYMNLSLWKFHVFFTFDWMT